MGCPECGKEEVGAMTPRTVYACGSSDYDQRPGTFKKGLDCKGAKNTEQQVKLFGVDESA